MATAGRGSIGVPGFIKGLEYAHGKYGSGTNGVDCCTMSHLIHMAINAVADLTLTAHFVNATRTKIDLGKISDKTLK